MTKRMSPFFEPLLQFRRSYDALAQNSFCDPLTSMIQILLEWWGDLRTFLVLSAVYFGIPAILSFREGSAFHQAPDFLSYFDDTFGIFNYALTYPLLLIALANYYQAIDAVFGYLQTKVIPSDQVDSLEKFVLELRARYSNTWLTIVPILIAAVVIFWYQEQFKAIGALKVYGGGGQGHLSVLGFYWFGVVCGTLTFVLVSAVFRHFIFVYSLQSFCERFHLQLHPKSPDKCSGMAPVGNVVIQATWVAALVGIIVMSYVGLGVTSGFGYGLLLTRVALAIPFYVLVVPLVLGYPIWLVHGAMQKARKGQLERISEQISLTLESISRIDLRGLREDDSVNGLLRRLWWSNALFDSSYSVVEGAPVWPIDFSSIRAVVPILGLVISPVATTIAQFLLGMK